MARSANPVETVHIRISTTPQVKMLLERLVAHGTFGKNVAEAAERLVTTKLNEMMGPATLTDALTSDRTT